MTNKAKHIFKPPVALNRWGDQDHRSENWIELFVDLFYVALYLKLGDVAYVCGIRESTIDYIASIFLGKLLL